MKCIITALVLWTTLAGPLILQCETTPFIRVQGNSTVNSQLSLTCIGETSNTRTLWLRNDAKLWASTNELCLLLQPQDNGVKYQCSKDNGLQSTVVTLNVTYDPKVEIKPSTSEIQVPLLSAFTLSCTIDANPMQVPAWYRGQNCDNRYEPQAGHSSVTWDGAMLKLMFSSTEGEDKGYYCCRAPQTCNTCKAPDQDSDDRFTS
uniref:Ig-like domain-containing protein n=1 Tax=Eptatretus burgeri TaxID=7764 RepID=A0A8C4Q4T7_EPTBU